MTESGGPSPMPSVAISRTATPSSLNPDGTKRTKICVYCGASPGLNPAYMEAARELARQMAKKNIALVYGGGTVGLMGELAKTLVSLSGPDSVHGIIPEALVRFERDPTYTSTKLDEKGEAMHIPEEKLFGKTTVVKDMHTRKQMMAQEVLASGPGSGFITLSGGYGTIEELMETCTWNQLGIHDKGICVLNIDGFYDGILAWIDRSAREGFMKQENKDILVSATTAEDAIKALREYKVSPARYKLQWGSS
ncbi:lysine decarboxylase family [Coniochaeta sp. 2T2.1]|nr:lysine decarboxylase family [Coniochaeta sp. 2T2.1]